MALEGTAAVLLTRSGQVNIRRGAMHI